MVSWMHPSEEYTASPASSKDILWSFEPKLEKLKDNEVAEGKNIRKKKMEIMNR